MKLRKLRELLEDGSEITVKDKHGNLKTLDVNDDVFDEYGDMKVTSMKSSIEVTGKVKEKKKKKDSNVDFDIDSSLFDVKEAMNKFSEAMGRIPLVDETKREDRTFNSGISKSFNDRRSFNKRWEDTRKKEEAEREKETRDVEKSTEILSEFAESTLKKSNEKAAERKKTEKKLTNNVIKEDKKED